MAAQLPVDPPAQPAPLAGRRCAVRQLGSLLDPPAVRTVHLLPAFDPYVIGSLRQLDAVMTGGDRC